MKRITNVTMSSLISALILLLFIPVLNAQTNTDDVHLFESFFFDVPISERPYVQGGLEYDSYDGGSKLNIGAQGGYGINEKLEIQAGWGFLSVSPDEGDGQSGISDLALYGRYKMLNSGSTTFAAGALVTLPIGSEDIGQGNLNFGGYGAVRHKLASGLVLCGTVGLIFYETTTIEMEQTGTDEWGFPIYDTEEKTEYETSFNIGVGTIYPINEKLCLVGEFSMHSEGDYMILTSGVDYNLGSGRVRAGLGIGLDDGAPDIKIMGGYLLTL